jgi:dienelactone hydrolase
VTVTPSTSALDVPIHIVVRGLAARQLATLTLRSVDSQGVPWASSAIFRASRAGVVDVDRVAPAPGIYQGAWGMGLLAMLQTVKPDASAYFWNGAHPQTFTVTVRSDGRRVASATFRRRFLSPTVRHRHLPLSSNRFYGDYYAPTVPGRRPAILAIGGSDGGNSSLSLVSGALAAHGYPVLAIAYFKKPGLPQSLSRIPLEYFVHALAWLRAQPHVDPKRIVTLGVSRGSEAALLLGAHYPKLVHAVIAAVPSSVALCSFPGCDGAAWMLHGKALPYTRQFNAAHPSDNPAAVIPVERIRGPILLNCAGNDQIWASCPFASAIMQRLDARHDRYRHVLYPASGAGHLIGFLLPDEPFVVGNTPIDQIARERFWPHLLAFLASV